MNNVKYPKVSVIMGIYNCADTLSDAIDSILTQTYQDFELILCNDGSTDNTYDIAKEYKQKFPDKIILLNNGINKGLNYTLNKCLHAAHGEFIARMDGDDRSLPGRFQKEVVFLERHPEYAIVSTELEIFDDEGVWGQTDFKQEPQPGDLVKITPFSHSACMIRKSVFDEVKGYSDDRKLIRVEDKHLWHKIYKAGYKGYNIKQVLYSYRDDRNGYSKRKLKYRFNSFYVSHLNIKTFHLPFYYYWYAVKPILTGLLPYWLYKLLHRKKLVSKKV